MKLTQSQLRKLIREELKEVGPVQGATMKKGDAAYAQQEIVRMQEALQHIAQTWPDLGGAISPIIVNIQEQLVALEQALADEYMQTQR